jgi:Tfp pilus assembly protein PilO
MKRNYILLALLVLFGGGAWAYQNWVYSTYPSTIRNLDRTIQLKDEKLISAQIINEELDLVANLIDKNLALSKSDSLADDASLPFMEDITTMIEDIGITLLKLEPGKKSARLDYVRTPYTLTIQSSYDQLGKFVNEMEKSDRLITVEQFEIDNAVRKSSAQVERFNDLSQKVMSIRVSTLTLIKQR